jgi:hypothetical protein
MKIIMMDECCLGMTDGEDKLSSLRLRKVRQLLKWIRSIDFNYALMEGIKIGELDDLERFLGYEEMLREMQIKGEIE